MERIRTVEYTVGEHFLPTVFYGDTTGLNDGEEADFDAFLHEAQTKPPGVGYEFGHWSGEGDTLEFERCEVTGLMSRCTTIVAVFFHQDA